MTFAQHWQQNFLDLRIKDWDKRWIRPKDLEIILPSIPGFVSTSILGKSHEGRPIYELTIGQGSKHVVAWSNMHGNETTALRGLMDLVVNLDHEACDPIRVILNEFTIHYLPQLNPDGAERYTRRNAQGIDLNRDARSQQTVEVQLLIDLITKVNPVVAFNLHDQRNIFHIGEHSATLSFLAPSVDVTREITDSRRITMDLIGEAYRELVNVIPGHIGRYTDEYYPTALGEFIQQKNIPTILIECGAAKDDPHRQQARMCMPIVLEAVLRRVLEAEEPNTDIYQSIPVNQKNQVDVLIKGVKIKSGESTFEADIALLTDEQIAHEQYQAVLKVVDLGDLRQHIGLNTFHCTDSHFIDSKRIGVLAHLDIETDKGRLTITEGQIKK